MDIGGTDIALIVTATLGLVGVIYSSRQRVSTLAVEELKQEARDIKVEFDECRREREKLEGKVSYMQDEIMQLKSENLKLYGRVAALEAKT